jgi:hypothetical protein
MNQDLSNFFQSISDKLTQQPPLSTRDPRSPYYSGITPDINLSGGMVGSNIPVYLPEGEVSIDRDRFDVSGRVGLKGRTQSGSQFGAGVTGDWSRQWLGFPEELQARGAPPHQRFGRGINVGAVDAFYETPGGTRFSAQYDPRQRGISGRVKIPF